MSSKGNQGRGKVNSKVNSKVFTYVYESENHEAFTNEIMTNLGLSRQYLYKIMKHLIDVGLVCRVVRSHANLYKALKSPHDPRVNSLIRGVTTAHIRTHSLGFKYKILRWNKDLRLGKTIKVNNWTKFIWNFNQCTIVKHPKRLIIHPPEVRGRNASENISKMQNLADVTASMLIDRHDIALEYEGLYQRPHHAVITKPLTDFAKDYIKAQGNISTESGMIDDSEGVGGEVEVYEPEDANTILNIGKEMREVKGLVRGSVRTQNAIANTQYMMAAGFREMQKDFRVMVKLMKKSFIQRRLGEFT